MSDFVLTPHSGLEAALTPGRHGALDDAPGVTVMPRTGLALASVVVRAGKTDDLTRRVEKAFGLRLPTTPQRVDAGPIGFVWAGLGQWLAITNMTDGHVFAQTLRRGLDGLVSVIDQSDGRSVIGVGGAKARDTLAKGIPLDFDPSVFRVGDAALTVAGHVNVHLWQVDDTPSYEIAVFRSFAAAFCDWLNDAASEFGVAVTAPA